MRQEVLRIYEVRWWTICLVGKNCIEDIEGRSLPTKMSICGCIGYNMDVVRTALAKGCLGGLGMAIVYIILGGALYLMLAQTALPQSLVMIISIAGGPVIGTAGALAILYVRARNTHGNTLESGQGTTGTDAP